MTRTPDPARTRAAPRTALLTALLAAAAAAAAASALVVACRGGERRSGFDGDAALRYARAQLAFGPRVPGSEGWRRGGDWIVAQMRTRADTVIEQRWTHVLANGDSLPMRNILARFRPGASDRVLYVTHWDTRPTADEEPDSTLRRQPIPGAEDGASGVGLFIALADLLRRTPPSVGVDLLFVDGEDYGSFPTMTDVLIGSTYFASHLPSPDYRPIFGVLWDMIGDRDLRIQQEQNSVAAAPEVVARVWNTARQLGYGNVFVDELTPTPITDDHVPLLEAGLRVIDVIDMDYPYHHKLSDTIDKLSAQSLGIVGDVAATLVTTQ